MIAWAATALCLTLGGAPEATSAVSKFTQKSQTGDAELPAPQGQIERQRQTEISSPAPKALSLQRLQASFSDYPRRRGIIRVADSIVADNVPMTLVAFDTKDEPIDVLAHYQADFERAHFFVVGAKELMRVGAHPGITAYEAETGLSRTVMIIPGDDGVNTVFLGLADAENKFQIEREAMFLGLPPYPGCDEPLSVKSTDGDRVSITLAFMTSDPPQKVVEYLTQASKPRGLSVRSMTEEDRALYPEDDQVRVLGLEGNGIQWTITARANPKAGQTNVVALAAVKSGARAENHP